jgi:hypothetical protein
MCAATANYTTADAEYVVAHRYIYGPIGERIAESALLIRDHLMRRAFVLPTIRLSPVAPYGHCMALSGNSRALDHVIELSEGVWVYLHRKWFGVRGRNLIDEVVLHELLHNELMQFGEPPQHKSAAWARRCQELSTRLGLDVRIERPRSRRIGGKITTATPDGCISYSTLRRWPAELLASGPTLRERIELYATTVNYTSDAGSTTPAA